MPDSSVGQSARPVADIRPRLLDLFCGAGGAAMGYFRAGFDQLKAALMLRRAA